MIFDARGKSGGEPHAVQTLREICWRKANAERLDCGRFSAAVYSTTNGANSSSKCGGMRTLNRAFFPE